jgi:phosphoribosylformylglycinamidine cyclo-ligase
VPLHYAAHVTGHGWRKLMRADRDLTYVVDYVPPVPPVLAFLQREAKLSDHEAYGTFNMGAGFVFYGDPSGVEQAQAVARERGIDLLHAGTVERGPKRVVIEPLGIAYEGASLNLR